MIATRSINACALLALVAVLALAGCGSGGSGSGYGGKSGSATTTGETAAKASTGGAPAALAVAAASGVGKVLVGADGFTVYDFHKDKGTTSSCYGACAEAWPPVTTTGAPKASDGAMSSQLGTTERRDGTMQVTYAGHPLYTYTADTKPGEANGQDVDAFGGQWYALRASGEEVPG